MVTRATLPHTYEEMGEEIYRGLTRVKDIPGIDYCEFIKVYEKLAKNLPRLARALTKKHCNCDTKKLFREIVLQLTHSR